MHHKEDQFVAAGDMFIMQKLPARTLLLQAGPSSALEQAWTLSLI
jgi:hypothetical protein